MRPARLILVAALCIGGAFSILAQQPKTAIETAVEEASDLIRRQSTELRTLSARVRALEARIDGIKLVAKDEPGNEEYGCGHYHKAERDSLVVMSGLRDGTGCNVRNLNYYKRFMLEIPKN